MGILLQVQDCPEALELHGVYQNSTHVFILTDYCRGGQPGAVHPGTALGRASAGVWGVLPPQAAMRLLRRA